ncbi:MAG: GntR family transcriptional regulator [Caulobacterales bacterium]
MEQWPPELQKARAYDRLLIEIILGALPPGARLDEDALCNSYGLGLAGVRDALARLSLEGLVIRRARVGTTVAPIDFAEVAQAFDTRWLIEPQCAALAAQRATRAEAARIASAFDGAEEAIANRQFACLVSMDRKFHRAVAEATHNPSLARIVIMLHHKAARYWMHTVDARTPEERILDTERHRDVAYAIAKGDAESAETAMRCTLREFSNEAAMVRSRSIRVEARAN